MGGVERDAEAPEIAPPMPKKESTREFIKKLKPQQTIRSLFHQRKNKKQPARSNINLDEALLEGQDEYAIGIPEKSEEASPERSLTMSDEYSPQESPHINIKLLPPGA